MLKPLSYLFATGFYSGLSPKAPGTMGTLCCALLMYILWNLPIDPQLISILSAQFLCLINTFLGVLCISYYYDTPAGLHSEKFDPQEIVIDEFAGFLLTLSFLPPTNLSLILAFIGFRIFDITKPWPVKLFEKLPGAWGIMMDDLAAGIYAGFIFLAYRYLS